MAPNQPNQPEPNHPPKREVQPLSIPTVGVGKDQVLSQLNIVMCVVLLNCSTVSDEFWSFSTM